MELVDMRVLETRAERCVGSNPTEGTIYAPMVELVDTLVLSTNAFVRVGSIPTRSTK